MIWSSIMRTAFFIITGGLLAEVCLAQTPARNEQGGLSAVEILQRMQKAYTKCKTYQDSGKATTVFVTGGGKRIDEKPFSTAFARPDRFRFEFKSSAAKTSPRRYIVWADGKDVRTWWDVKPGVERMSSLSLALAGATGVSSGSAHTIPALLMPDQIEGKRLTDLTKLSRLGDAKLGSVDCYRIEGSQVIADTDLEDFRKSVKKVTGKDAPAAKHGPQTLWIDKSTFLIRRIDQQTQFTNFRTESTTIYEPLIDEKLSDQQLQFDPPGK